MLYDDYLEYTKKYQSQYGTKTVVLMEVGSFYELYAVENDQIKEGAPMSEVCALLNIQSTRKNKSILQCSRTNPMMAGFPSSTLKKFTDLLIQDQYTVVLVEQTTPPPNPKREVTQVISPSTYMEDTTSFDPKYLMVWLVSSGNDRYKKQCLVLTVVLTDLSTAETFVMDSMYGEEMTLLQEGTRVLTAMPPKEIVILAEMEVADDVSQSFVTLVRRYPCCVHDRTKESLVAYQRIAYQTSVLKKVFPDTGMMSPIEYLDMERHPLMSTTFVYLLQFVYEHNDTMINHLRKPTWVRTNQSLRITHNALEQLNIIPKTNESSLMKILNTCDTSIGKRKFHKLITCPTTSVSDMIERYNAIDQLRDKQLYKEIREFLSSTKDVERLYRRIMLLQLQPSELSSFLSSLDQIRKLSSWCLDHQFYTTWTEQDHSTLTLWIETELNRWNLEEMNVQMNQLENNIYQKGVHEDIDTLTAALEKDHGYFKEMVNAANTHMGQEFLKLELTSERTYVLTMTTKRWETHLMKHGSFTAQPYSSTNKTVMRISFPKMDMIQQRIHTNTNELRSLVKMNFMTDLALYSTYKTFMERIVDFIGTVDVASTSAKNADVFRYKRPIVSDHEQSCIQAKGVRHPLIERIQIDIPYVANDVTIGGNGILLHGINASGKSSYMKSIGMNLIMAQAGMFVAAENWTFTPYLDIFTRIPGGDNLFKGHSTFVSEMVEVRAILTQSSEHSLIIGDELASGTESVSAVSIVAAGIVTLAKKNASFLFATHLHEVATLDIIKSLPNVQVCHMSVHYDDTTKVLIYDRVLKQGSGDMLYGLEVCKSLNMPSEFLHLANTIRQSYLNMPSTLVNTKVSNYSSHVIMDQCSICKKEAVETHHIQEQHNADKDGYIGVMHKNVPHNLMTVCTSCHDKIHNEEMKVDGYKMTSNGAQLQIRHEIDTEKKDIGTINERVRTLRKQGHTLQSISIMTGLTLYKIKKIIQ